jgi:hypothetical protein
MEVNGGARIYPLLTNFSRHSVLSEVFPLTESSPSGDSSSHTKIEYPKTETHEQCHAITRFFIMDICGFRYHPNTPPDVLAIPRRPPWFSIWFV